MVLSRRDLFRQVRVPTGVLSCLGSQESSQWYTLGYSYVHIQCVQVYEWYSGFCFCLRFFQGVRFVTSP